MKLERASKQEKTIVDHYQPERHCHSDIRFAPVRPDAKRDADQRESKTRK